ncbi:transaldolase [Hyaloscypha bicolor E]|uniref:Transaldolase n=1 Tax=Hyaloscypha bicolor E TaxID=1095630 RepID=A0A2J6TQB1_9HELO|nr:transaldolase [Hyaloscypha bicolor E]PMD65206.1 transaldolase [Hyaloscypha bicolor E]
MAPPQNLLEVLRERTIVDCDTMDADVAENIGKPVQFADCTSNQAIAYFELQKPKHKTTLRESRPLATALGSKYPNTPVKELFVEISMVKLQLEISKHVTGFVHVQTNPYYSYDTVKTVKNAERIVEHFKLLDNTFDPSRVCIKIPSTWEGLEACRLLESSGIATLATTLFTIEQAWMAGDVGCEYIAPYVNELKVHFEEGFVDRNKSMDLCVHAHRLYSANKVKTKVLPASLTSIDEIMALDGVDHITISPQLLQELVRTPASEKTKASLFDGEIEVPPMLSFTNEAEYRIAFTLSGKGEGERKLTQAINIFCEMQTKLEAMMNQ